MLNRLPIDEETEEVYKGHWLGTVEDVEKFRWDYVVVCLPHVPDKNFQHAQVLHLLPGSIRTRPDGHLFLKCAS